MSDKETMQTEVYDKVKDIKNRFYNAKTQDEWNQIKEDYKVVMAKAKELMTPEFYEKYNKGVQDAIAKIYGYKEKQFNKAKVFTPKVTYLLQDDLAKALTEYIKLKTIELSMELEAKKAIEDEKNYK
jgi:bisphosphoglycerate-independent phosphoglycerate mutase (AlkP superfamily)